MLALKLMRLTVCGFHLSKLVWVFSRPEEWASRVMDRLILNRVRAAECGKTSCFLWEFFKMAGTVDEKTLSRLLAAEVLHEQWAMQAVFGGLASRIFDEFVGLGFAHSLWGRRVKPMTFEIYDHKYTMFGGALREN